MVPESVNFAVVETPILLSATLAIIAMAPIGMDTGPISRFVKGGLFAAMVTTGVEFVVNKESHSVADKTIVVTGMTLAGGVANTVVPVFKYGPSVLFFTPRQVVAAS